MRLRADRLAPIRRAIFARHCNPWSAWTRWASTPLTLLPVWTRRPSHTVLVCLWLAINPVVFGRPPERPDRDKAWATRAMLGEELWITRRPRDAAMAVSVVTSAVALTGVLAARRRRPAAAAVATATQMALTLVYWEQMARYYESRQRPAAGEPK